MKSGEMRGKISIEDWRKKREREREMRDLKW